MEHSVTFEIGLVLTILAIAIVLFASEKIRVDVIALMVLLALLLSGLLTTEEAFSGFASPAVVTVWAIYIVSASLTHTGIADFLGEYVGRLAGTSERRMVFAIMMVVGGMSAFMNNIGAAAVLLPVVSKLGRKAHIPVSRLLIPLAFGSLLGGVTTLIGTPPNLLVSSALGEAGFEPFGLFDFTPMGLIILVSSVTYMTFWGRHLLPRYEQVTHHHDEEKDLTAEYHLSDKLLKVRVLAESPVVGKTIVESQLGEALGATVIGIQRNGRLRLGGILPNAHFQTGDILLLNNNGASEAAFTQNGLSKLPGQLKDDDLQSSEVGLAEIVISQKAPFIGKTIREVDFRGRFGLTVLAMWRGEQPLTENLADTPLRLGDTLLVLGRHERLNALQYDPALLLLHELGTPPPRLHKAPLNLVIFVSMITLVGLGWLHISEAAVLGAVLSILTGCLNMDEAYNAIEWKSVFLIAGMLPMGIAMEKTGTAQFLADEMLRLVGGSGPTAVMVGLFVLTTILTAFMSNAAAAVLAAPIAIESAAGMGISPYAFAMAVAIAASNSFVTPIGHQACILVYGPGGYRFFDFAKVGLPLTLLILVLIVLFLPVIWPYF